MIQIQILLPVVLFLSPLVLQNQNIHAFTTRLIQQTYHQQNNQQRRIKSPWRTTGISFPLKEQPSNNEEETQTTTTINPEEFVDEDAPVDVVGAEVFFGGRAEKEELYDPVAEETATATFEEVSYVAAYERFDDRSVFENDFVGDIAKKLQLSLNNICHVNTSNEVNDSKSSLYSPTNFVWNSPLSGKNNPLEEIKKSKDFYKSIHVSILSGKDMTSSSSKETDGMDIEIRWEVCILWPTVYEPRVLLTGTSKLHVLQKPSSTEYSITSQTDVFDSKEYLASVGAQLIPRFWDLYHIGMTPSAQVLPRTLLSGSNPLTPYKTYEIAPTLALVPSIVDSNNRKDRFGQGLPNHAFSTVIKTMGPKKQRYIPSSPVEVQIVDDSSQGATNKLLKWIIYVPTQISSLITQQYSTTVEQSGDTCQYVYQPKRIVATLPYGGSVQDEEVSVLRKTLYESILSQNSEYKPKLDSNGKPIFFFWLNDCKACFVEDGLGMAVYDYRPMFFKCNEVGIELERK